jgi:hypothetical protein
VAGHSSVSNLGRAFRDHHHVGELALADARFV